MGGLRKLFDVAAAIAVVAGISMMVRKGSHGPQFVAALGAAFVNAAQGTVGATLVPDSDLPAAVAPSSSSSSSLASAGGVIGSAVGGAGGAIGGTYSPSSYNIPSGPDARGRSYW